MAKGEIREQALPQKIVIDGREAVITYVNELWHPVTKAESTMAIAVFKDGGKEIYVMDHAAK